MLAETIESYGKAYESLIIALNEFPETMWKFKPSPKQWSIHEIILHLADSEANSYVRCRKFLAEPGDTVMAYEQDVWADKLEYHNQSTEDALELFRLLRKMSYYLIKNLPEEKFENTVMHPERGVMKMRDWLNVYEQHTFGHIRQMQRTFDEWQKAAGI
jgi:hypothetical protein